MMGIVPNVEEKINDLREVEGKAALRWRLNITVGVSLSFISVEGSKWFTFILFAIIVYVKQRNGDDSAGINVNILFTSLAILNIALQRLQTIIQCIPGIVNAFGCFVRIEEFLLSETKSDNRLQHRLDYRRSSESATSTPAALPRNIQDIELSPIRRESRDVSKPVVQLKQVTVNWNQEKNILNDVTMDITAGDLTMLIGP